MVPPPGVAPAPSFPAAICLAGAPGSAELQTEKPLHPYQDYPHRATVARGGTRHDVVDEEEQRSARQVLQEGPGDQGRPQGAKGGPQHHPPHRVHRDGPESAQRAREAYARHQRVRAREASGGGRDTGCALCVFQDAGAEVWRREGRPGTAQLTELQGQREEAGEALRKDVGDGEVATLTTTRDAQIGADTRR